MAKSTVFQMRLDPQKKALWEGAAKDAGVSLASFIEIAVDHHVKGYRDFMEKHGLNDEADLSEEPEPGKIIPALKELLETKPRWERKPVGKIAAALKKEGK